MNLREDPEGIETQTLHELINFSKKRVLEIGCGDGRLTWRYADNAAHVTAIDPIKEDIETALEDLPEKLRDRVEFLVTDFEDFKPSSKRHLFDIILFSWSL